MQKSKNSGADGIRYPDLWIKKSVALPTALWRLGCKWLTTKYLYSDRHYESPNLELLGKVPIFRHDKHLNFYRTVNIWRLILQKFLNYKSTKL
jgi:hypothetical protein